MDLTGHIVLGEPGKPAPKSGGISGLFSVPGRDSGSQGRPSSGTYASTAQRTDVPNLWEIVPKPLRNALIGVLALILLWALGAFRLIQPTPLPTSFEERLSYVAEAFAYNEPSHLSRIAASGTRNDVLAWHQKLYAEAKLGARREDGHLVSHTFANVPGEGAQEKRVVLFITPPIPKYPDDPDDKSVYLAQERRRGSLISAFASGAMPDGSFSIPIVWKSEGGQWWLDGTASLKAAANALPAPEAGNAASKRAS